MALCSVVPVWASDEIVLTYEVTGFPLDTGMSVPVQFWQPHRATFARIADMCSRDSLLYVELEPTADATRYGRHHDLQNAAILISRFDATGNQLELAGVPYDRITYVKPKEISDKVGPEYRKVTVRVRRHPAPDYVTRPDVERMIKKTQQPVPPATQIVSNTYLEQPKVWLGIGAVYNGDKVLPMLYCQLGNDWLRGEAEGGYSFYRQHRTYCGEDLSVTYRYWNVGLAWRPVLYGSFDILAGWQRFETYSTRFGMYLEKLEGPTLGLRLFSKRWAVTGKWTPAEVSVRGQDVVTWDISRVYVGVALYTTVLGGGK
ncbi:MAG: hypothetical protein V1916_00970 [Patescibacteria group bacterium]